MGSLCILNPSAQAGIRGKNICHAGCLLPCFTLFLGHLSLHSAHMCQEFAAWWIFILYLVLIKQSVIFDFFARNFREVRCSVTMTECFSFFFFVVLHHNCLCKMTKLSSQICRRIDGDHSKFLDYAPNEVSSARVRPQWSKHMTKNLRLYLKVPNRHEIPETRLKSF